MLQMRMMMVFQIWFRGFVLKETFTQTPIWCCQHAQGLEMSPLFVWQLPPYRIAVHHRAAGLTWKHPDALQWVLAWRRSPPPRRADNQVEMKRLTAAEATIHCLVLIAPWRSLNQCTSISISVWLRASMRLLLLSACPAVCRHAGSSCEIN